jgi:hypothetical protein
VTEITSFILSVFRRLPEDSKGFNKFKHLALEILDEWRPIDKSRSRSQGVEFLDDISKLAKKLGRVPKCWENIIKNITEADPTKVNLNQYIRALKVTGLKNLSFEATNKLEEFMKTEFDVGKELEYYESRTNFEDIKDFL